MLGLNASLCKPTSLAKLRSVQVDGVGNAAFTATDYQEMIPPQGGAGSDRSFSVAFWVKFNNTDANQGIFSTQANSGEFLNMYMKSSRSEVQLGTLGVVVIEAEGGSVIPDAMKQSWMLWIFTHNRPASSPGNWSFTINGNHTYGEDGSGESINQAFNYDQDAGGCMIGSSMLDANTSNWSSSVLNGKVAQFGFWHRALSLSEQKAMYNDPRMDWRWNSGEYSNAQVKSVYKPFSNEVDDLENFVIRELISYTPPTQSSNIYDGVASNWIPLGTNTVTDLGSGELKFTVGNNVIAAFGIARQTGIWSEDLSAGQEVTWTFKAKIISSQDPKFGVFGTSNIITLSGSTYQEYTITYNTATTADIINIFFATATADDEVHIKDVVCTKTIGASGKKFTLSQTDQINEDGPGNEEIA